MSPTAIVPLARWWMHDHMGGGWWILSVLGMLLLFGLVVAVVVSIVRDREQRDLSARELLDRRLASGELTPEEYEERRAALDRRPSGPATGAAA